MFFRMEHTCICVQDMARTLSFYEKALHLEVLRRKEADDRELVFLGNPQSGHSIEVVRFFDQQGAFDLGDNPCHIAFRTDTIEEAKALHEQMGCISRDLPAFGVYFIQDPDGYECEIMPVRN